MYSLSIYITVTGDAVIGDAFDEDAPLIKLEFCNEAAHLDDEAKEVIALAAGEHLINALKAQPTNPGPRRVAR